MQPCFIFRICYETIQKKGHHNHLPHSLHQVSTEHQWHISDESKKIRQIPVQINFGYLSAVSAHQVPILSVNIVLHTADDEHLSSEDKDYLLHPEFCFVCPCELNDNNEPSFRLSAQIWDCHNPGHHHISNLLLPVFYLVFAQGILTKNCI